MRTCKICGSTISDQSFSHGHYCANCRAELVAGVSLTALLQTFGKEQDVKDNKNNKDKYITK